MLFNKSICLMVLAATGALARGRGGAGRGGAKSGGTTGAGAGAGAASNSTTAATSAVASSAAATSAAEAATQTFATGTNVGEQANDDGSGTLDQAAIQTASASIGKVNVTAGEADSETSTDNFINTCLGKTLTNGIQFAAGSCNGIPMGDIPASTNMVSAIITNPATGGTPLAADTTFTLEAQVANLNAGVFTNANSTYYAAPQRLGSGGNVVGHTHFTVQDLGGTMNPTTPLSASTFAFFKGVDNAGNGDGLLSAAVAGGLPAGCYRVCTMTSSSNHQPVLMPIAQRGAQDDCTKFTVSGSSTAAAGGSASAASAASATTAAAASSASTAATGGKTGAGKGFGGKGAGRGRFAARKFIA